MELAAAIAVGPLLAATVVGAVGALGVGRLAADLGPIASAEALASSGVGTVPIGQLLAVVGIVGGADRDCGGLAAGVPSSCLGRRVHRSRQPLADAAMRSGHLPFASASAPLTTGSRGGARSSIGAAIAAVTVLVATRDFSANLSRIVAEPARYAPNSPT